MLNRIRLINYRCFEDSEIWLKKLTLFVGSNNAGKSTLTEALRIIGFAIRKFQNTTSYSQAPRNLNLPAKTVGVNIKAEEHKIELKTVVHLYKEDTYAEIIASFGKKIRIHVYLTSEYIFAVLEADGNIINKKTDALKLEGLSLHVMPQLRLIHEEEQRLSQETVARGMETRLSSIHFRNEIYQYREQYFEVFKETAERTWPGLRIQEIHHDINENKITLIVFDSGYSAEIGMMGSGLQMWLQIVWFICHNAESSSVVLDEPDVYMHPDLQRKILDIVRNRFAQVIIATHSVEMISDVDADQIITIDKKSRKMGYADSYRAVQDIVNNLGSIHNLSLTRLGVARKCVFVEGEDMKILARFQRALRMDSPISIDQLPTIRLGGWTRFSEALGAARLFYNETSAACRAGVFGQAVQRKGVAINELIVVQHAAPRVQPGKIAAEFLVPKAPDQI